MNKKETVQIMAVLKAAYPQYYKDTEEIAAAVSLWQSMFEDEQYELVSAGVKAFIASDTKGFPPCIGQVKEQIARLTRPVDAMTEQEAWSLVKKALRNSVYGYMEEFASLPEPIRATIRTPSTLREWGQISMQELDTVVASNFMRSYRDTVRNRHEFALLPESVKQFAAKEQVYEDHYDHDALEKIIRAKLEKRTQNEQQGEG